jgi:hypothetical protein
MCGEPIAPADRITSRPAPTRPRRRARAREFDTDRALAIEKRPMHQRMVSVRHL